MRFLTYVVDETIFRCIVLGLQSTEEGLFSTEDLNGTGRVFGKTEQTASMADESCTDELTDQSGKVGSNSVHTIAKVFSELSTIGGY